MATLYTFPFDIPKTYYRGIGEVIARMSLIEHQVMVVIGKLLRLKDPKQVRVSFMGMTIKARLGAMQALASNWAPTPQLKQEICSIARATRRFVEVRNSFAHGQWGYATNKRKLHVGFAKESLDFYLPKSKHYTSSELLAIAKDVRATSKRLYRVTIELDALLQP